MIILNPSFNNSLLVLESLVFEEDKDVGWRFRQWLAFFFFFAGEEESVDASSNFLHKKKLSVFYFFSFFLSVSGEIPASKESLSSFLCLSRLTKIGLFPLDIVYIMIY